MVAATEPKLRWQFERQAAEKLAKDLAERAPPAGPVEVDDRPYSIRKLAGDLPPAKPKKRVIIERDSEKRLGKRRDGKPNGTHVWTLPDWKNPYGPEHRWPRPANMPRSERLASVMRVIGHPLSIMRKWPEVVGTPAPIDKAEIEEQSMAEQKAVAAHRAALEKSIEKLAARRDIIKAELASVEDELKSLLSMLKASGVESTATISTSLSGKVKILKPKAVTKKLKELSVDAKGINDIARKLIAASTKEKPATPAALAELTGQSNKNAAQALWRLARAGEAKMLGRGTYGKV